jgi:hypothetical protein
LLVVATMRVIGQIAVLALERVEGEPAGLLVGEIDAPLDVDKLAAVAAALDMIAELERPPFRSLVVIDENLEPRPLALHPAVLVLERGHVHRPAVGRDQGVSLRVAFQRQPRRRLRREVELRFAVAEPRDADPRMDPVRRQHFVPPHLVEKAQGHALELEQILVFLVVGADDQ